MKVFSGRAHPDLAKQICEYLGLPLGRAIIGNFPDGEISCKIDEDVRGRDVFIVQPTCPPVNENLMELLIMIDSFKRASAERITAVMPYFGYARQDRKDEGRVPITAKLVANLITRAGADRVLTMDLHAAQIQGFFDIPVDHLYAAPVIDDYFKALDFERRRLRRRQSRRREHQAGAGAHGPARRAPGDHRQAPQQRRKDAAGERHRRRTSKARVALIFDDMISTAGSICGAAEVMHQAGAKQIYLAATHGLLGRRGHRDDSQQAPIDEPDRHRHRSRCRPKSDPRKSPSSASPRCWARPSNASTATSRSAGCSISRPFVGPACRAGLLQILPAGQDFCRFCLPGRTSADSACRAGLLRSTRSAPKKSRPADGTY